MHGNPPPPPYVMLENNGGQNIRPPPYRQKVPRYSSQATKSSSCCCRCLCCCCCFFFFLIIAIAGGGYYFYAVYQPKAPSYKIQEMVVKQFEVQHDLSINTELLARIKAENPNKNIGFIYGTDSSVSVNYNDSTICTGKLPAFEQPQKNTTIMEVTLKGNSPYGSGLQHALAENKTSEGIPLLVKAKAPVKIVVGSFPTRQFLANIKCNVLVDSLEKDKPVKVLKNECKPDVKF